MCTERPQLAGATFPSARSRSTERILTGLGVPEASRPSGTAVAVVLGQQLHRPDTGAAPAEHLVDGLMTLTRR
ncbi:hypothetical protein [Streptomyces meridianus]|uniref:Uncharacterized protein n=1 Tax=Streptomyces meridianus TaxID=2938945 RepID=A0ABT0X3W1_9ACTN|nr:hypothetical protein [Streptomyces meridianus]MCM2576603.1 hypothetical protein [Streptomyces meridianus]